MLKKRGCKEYITDGRGEESHVQSRAAKCPFYIFEKTHDIQCEGIARGTRIILRCVSAERCREHRLEFCNRIDGYDKCPIYRAIMEQYK